MHAPMDRRRFLQLAGLGVATLGLSRPARAADDELPADWVVSPDDAQLIVATLALGRRGNWAAKPMGETVGAFGWTLLGTPYVEHTLDDSGAEKLMITLSGLDCVTFCEISLAFARTLRTGGTTVRDFGNQLQAIRYRGGERSGYISRLHYFEEWMEDNARRGNVQLVGQLVGGEVLGKQIDFMTTHRSAYPVLAGDSTAVGALRGIEARLNERRRYYVPKEQISAVAGRMQTGDIIGITTTVPGLLVSHTGLAYRKSSGALHFLHEPIVGKSVQLTEQPLAEYLMGNSRSTGILIARPIAPKS